MKTYSTIFTLITMSSLYVQDVSNTKYINENGGK